MAGIVLIDLVLSVNNFGLFADAKRLAEAPQDYIGLLALNGLPETHQFVNVLLNASAPPVVTPFEFADPKSQAAYFAKFTPPYHRTNFVRQWAVRVTELTNQGFLVRMENDADYAAYVYGPRQVPGHRTTGWPRYMEAIEANGIRGMAWEEAGRLWIRVTQGAGSLRARVAR